MDYEIKTLLKVEDDFTPLDDVLGSPADPNYIEGAIVWRIDRKVLLDERHWDLVDQLWAYIINGLGELLKRGVYETYFPDQPLLLGFKMLTGKKVQVTIGDDKAVVECSVMFLSLIEGGKSFLEKMCELVSQHGDTWNRYLREIERIRASLGKG